MMRLQAQLSSDMYADPAYKHAQKLYFLASQSEAYMGDAENAFKNLIRKYGARPPLQMYLSGITALKARYAINPFAKRDYFFQAESQMDAIVKQNPSDPEVRFIRGSFYYYLPFFFGKRQDARDDLYTLTDLLLKNSELYQRRYSSEALRAIIGFLQQTGWIAERDMVRLRRLYASLW
ncbi:MAG: hypothetical protein NZZ60_02970 [Bacteroidia bacterium]|nr:hypothetical protein [Bacteroidia bacterium]MDW8417101.1 hypothetical protein [Bacteroidia bacterium]